MRGREIGRSPGLSCLCANRTHAAGTVSKLAHTKRIAVHFFVITETVSESSAHGPTLSTGVILSVFRD